MKVALVDCRPLGFTKIYWCSAPSSVNTFLPPLDLLYISSYLEKHKVETKVIKPNEVYEEDFDFFVFHVSRQTLDGDLKAVFDASLFGDTIVFGCDVSADPMYWKQFEFIGHVVVGEPEAEILSIVVNKEPEVLNLNGLYPNYGKVDVKGYRCAYIKQKPFVVSLSSRGCPHNCVFCSSHLMFGRVFRKRTAFDVVTEMKQYQDSGVGTCWFYDDTFTFDRQRVFDVCADLKRRDVNIYWKTQTRADCLDRKMLEALREANCYELGIGVESGNQRILNLNRKGLKLDKVRQVFKDCNDVGISTVAFFVLGLPYETRKTVQDTIDFAKKIEPSYCQFVLATPYRGTEFYDLALSEGWLTEVEATCLHGYCLNMNNLSPEYMKGLLVKANREFYGQPRYLLKNLRGLNRTKIKAGLNLLRK